MELIGGSRRSAAPVHPPVDVFVAGDPPVLTVEMDVAGIEPDEVEITLDGDLLVIRGERRPSEGGRRAYQHAEIEWGRFERGLRLNAQVDIAAARADYRRGILSITLPLAPAPPPSRVTITVRGPGAGA